MDMKESVEDRVKRIKQVEKEQGTEAARKQFLKEISSILGK